MRTVGIVGQGFVGTAIREGMKHVFDIQTFDLNPEKSSTCKNLEELCKKTDIVFVCLPTPMKEDGSCDISIVENCVEQLATLSEQLNKRLTLCLKSTIPPGTTWNFQCDIGGPHLDITHNPEFLTEANANADFANQDRIIVGGSFPGSEIMKEVYQEAFPDVEIILCSSDMSELVKYATNNFLTVKVAFANELFEIAHEVGVNYDELVDIVLRDKRIGKSHWKVPGPMAADMDPDDITDRPAVVKKDGKAYLPGYAGSCFVKDVNGMVAWCKENNVTCEMLTAAWNKNLRVRPERDWENLEGRAVVKKV